MILSWVFPKVEVCSLSLTWSLRADCVRMFVTSVGLWPWSSELGLESASHPSLIVIRPGSEGGG